MKELFLKGVLLSEICDRFNLKLFGTDRYIRKFGSLDTVTSQPEYELTYAYSPIYIQKFIESDIACCIIPSSLKEHVSNEKVFLITESDPETLFFEIVCKYGKEGKWEKVSSNLDDNNFLSRSAIIYGNVKIGNNCKIFDNVVILPNTIIGNNVVIKPNTVIGGDGFLVKKINDQPTVVPHFGGVLIEDNVEIGSGVTIDKGMFGEFTTIGKDTKIDNLVHNGHTVIIGQGCIITAGNVVGGSTTIGNNVWLGINSTINQLLTIGESCFVGSGTLVSKSFTSHRLVVGSPARSIARVCHCRSRLSIEENRAECPKCHSKYNLIGDSLILRNSNNIFSC